MPAYRSPNKDPDAARHARHQTRAARIVGLVLIWGMAAVLIFVADRAIPPQHLPWKPLRVVDPVGAATRVKAAGVGGDLAACHAILKAAGLSFALQPPKDLNPDPACAPPDSLAVTSGPTVLLPPDLVTTCREAVAVSIWERQVVQPAARETLGQPVVGLKSYGSYTCRRIYGQASGNMSEHAHANALDVGGFKLADGSDVMVERDFRDPGPKGVFLRRVRDGACQVFISTLSPDYNAAHRNHLHLDMGGDFLCR